jgi:hypothetical protein
MKNRSAVTLTQAKGLRYAAALFYTISLCLVPRQSLGAVCAFYNIRQVLLKSKLKSRARLTN